MLNETEYLDLIVGYLDNPEDEKRHSDVLSFRSQSVEHDNYFLEIEKVWSNSAKSSVLETIDVKNSTKRFRKSLSQSTRNSKNNWYLLSRVAAVFALALFGLWLYKLNSDEFYIIRVTQQHQIDTVSLPDGSKVILSENSGLKYSNKFNKDQRDIYLTKGKAFFKIKKDPDHPFKVKMGESEVLVVGTSFNLSLTTQKIDLDVKTGKVVFSPNKNGASSILTKGQALTYHIQRKEMTMRLSQNADSWLTKELVFVDTPLEEVCKQLSAYYKINISLKENKGANKKLNATFTDQTLENVLVLLNETYNIKIRKENNQIILINP